MDAPAYSLAVAARYARVPYQTLRYWAIGKKSAPATALITLPTYEPPTLSFLNLLECHVLQSLRTTHEMQILAVRKSLEMLAKIQPSPHPLLEPSLSTDGMNLFIATTNEVIINLTHGGQIIMKEVLDTYLQRIKWTATGGKFFPFVYNINTDEPKIISIAPTIAFGRSVIDRTGIATAVVAARFNARESIQDLAEEYGRTPKEIEEAVRWEAQCAAAAA